MLSPEGDVMSWNNGAARIKGYAADEIVGKHMSVFYTEEDRQRGHPLELLNEAVAKGTVEEEGWRVRKDGQRFWADVTITALFDDNGRLRGFGKVTRDLTERKRAEDVLSELSGRLLHTQDLERRKVARELHDLTSPLLTSLTAKLYGARQRAKNGDPAMLDFVEDTLTLCEATSTMIRTISSMLHPSLLEHSGLAATLRWYTEAFSNRTGMKIELNLADKGERPSAEIETSLFRLTQEWLNAMVSRGDRTAVVSLRIDPRELELRIETRGAPWTDHEMADLGVAEGELGVLFAASRQRLRQLNGTLVVERKDPMTRLAAVISRRRTS
jgi:PAS domain S-box-containing protein